MLKKLFFILISGVCALSTSAQQLEWSVDMNAVLNNREGGNNETPAQTFIFTRITPQIGVSMDHGRHSIMGGVTWYQPMIDNLAEYKVLPALHYHYKDSRKGYEFKFGVIPNELNNNIALFLRSDSINYVQPNIKGAVINIQKPHFWLYSWIDWRQFRTNYKREAFDATAQVGWRTTKGYNHLSASAILRYNHLAKSYKNPLENEGVVDNVVLSPQLGFTHHWHNGKISAWAGMLLTLDRDRIESSKWHTQAGFIGQLTGSWRWLSLIENIYAGKRQMPLYEKYGSLLYQGDQYYHNKFYSRTDLVATIFSRDFLNLEARLTFHATDKTTAFWQQLAVRFYLDRNLWNLHKKHKKGANGIALQSQF